MIDYILIFIASVTAISILHYVVNLGPFNKFSRKMLLGLHKRTLGIHRFILPAWWGVLFWINGNKTPKAKHVARKIKKRPMSISEWANKPRTIPLYLKSIINQIENEKTGRVVVKKIRDSRSDFDNVFIASVQCGNPFPWFLVHPDGTQEEIDENRISSLTEFKQQYLANPWKSALSIPEEKRTPFEKWKASDPANTWAPWWLSDRIMKSMPEVCEHEYIKEQQETQHKAFEAGLNVFTEKINSYIDLLKNALNK